MLGFQKKMNFFGSLRERLCVMGICRFEDFEITRFQNFRDAGILGWKIDGGY